MPRDITAGEETVLQARASGQFLKVEIQNAAAAWIDYSDFFNFDWQDTAEVAQSAEQRIAEATFEIAREIEGVGSLSPLMNADIKVGRGMRIYGARVAPGATPAGGDWKQLFLGLIDTWDAAHDPMVLQARDISGKLFDRWVEATVDDYAEEGGTPVQEVMQAILDDWADGMVLVVPAGSSILTTPWLIKPYLQEKMRVLDALTALNTIGYALEYRWSDSAGAFVLTFYEPNRAATTPEWEFGPDDYYDVLQLRADRRLIRNAIDTSYTNEDGERETYSVEDAASIAAYGRFWMELEFGDTDAINTAAEAERVVDPALLDLATPYADHQIEVDLFWPVQLSDYYRHSANAVHYAVAQDFGVVGFTHRFAKGQGRTLITTRGKPIGTVTGWLQREVRRRPPAETEPPTIRVDAVVRQEDGSVVIYGWVSANALSVAYAYNVAVDPSQPTTAQTEDQGAATTGGGLHTTIVAGQFVISLPADTVDYQETIKGLVIAYATIAGVGEDGTKFDHGVPAPFEATRTKITQAGQVSDAVIQARMLLEGARRFHFTGDFSASDWDTVAWSAGDLNLSDGTTYAISAGNTGNLAAGAHWVYFDSAVSTTTLQVAPVASVALTETLIYMALVRRALGGSGDGQLAFYVAAQGLFGINGDVILADAIRAGHIAANEILAIHIDVINLRAISAHAGELVSGYFRNAGNTAAIKLDDDPEDLFPSLPATNFLDFTAAGNDPFLKHPALELQADGDATFSGALSAASGTFAGTVSGTSFTGATATFTGSVRVRGGGAYDSVKIDTDEIEIWNSGLERGLSLQATAGTGIVNGGTGGLTLESAADVLIQSLGGTAILAHDPAAAAGFYGSAGAAQQTVTGSRGGNAALASLLTALAALGLIVDGSS